LPYQIKAIQTFVSGVKKAKFLVKKRFDLSERVIGRESSAIPRKVTFFRQDLNCAENLVAANQLKLVTFHFAYPTVLKTSSMPTLAMLSKEKKERQKIFGVSAKL
jgi:hypothetical protein